MNLAGSKYVTESTNVFGVERLEKEEELPLLRLRRVRAFPLLSGLLLRSPLPLVPLLVCARTTNYELRLLYPTDHDRVIKHAEMLVMLPTILGSYCTLLKVRVKVTLSKYNLSICTSELRKTSPNLLQHQANF